MKNISTLTEINEFQNVQVIYENGEPLFRAKDVARVLGFKDTVNAIKQHCRWVVKRDTPHPQNPNKTLTVSFIPEGDVYRLIFHSRLPGAKRFTHFVCHEVLPSIRKYGMYITPQKQAQLVSVPDIVIRLPSLKYASGCANLSLNFSASSGVREVKLSSPNPQMKNLPAMMS